MEDEVKDVEQSSDAQENAADSQKADESSEDIASRLAKAEELANNYKIRAEKAERKVKETVKEAPKQEAKPVGDLSAKDIYALMEAKVPEEDIEVVQKYAKLEGISLTDALKSSIVKGILNEKAEQRTVAAAANVGSSKRGSGKVSDDVLLAKAKKGELPTSDEDLDRLIMARKGYKN